MPALTIRPFPSGGAFMIFITANQAGNISLTRLDNLPGSTPYTLFSGPAAFFPAYFDTGDQLNSPLQAGVGYTYTLTDIDGSASVGPITPAYTLSPYQDIIGTTLAKMLTGAVESAPRPSSNTPVATVVNALPLTGFPQLPIISINNDLFQQEFQFIGRDVDVQQDDGFYSYKVFARYIYTINIFSQDFGTREFYTQLCMATLSLGMRNWGLMGYNQQYSLQYSQTMKLREGNDPGFYNTEIMLSMVAPYIAGYRGTLQLINSFTENITAIQTSI